MENILLSPGINNVIREYNILTIFNPNAVNSLKSITQDMSDDEISEIISENMILEVRKQFEKTASKIESISSDKG